MVLNINSIAAAVNSPLQNIASGPSYLKPLVVVSRGSVLPCLTFIDALITVFPSRDAVKEERSAKKEKRCFIR